MNTLDIKFTLSSLSKIEDVFNCGIFKLLEKGDSLTIQHMTWFLFAGCKHYMHKYEDAEKKMDELFETLSYVEIQELIVNELMKSLVPADKNPLGKPSIGKNTPSKK